MAAVCAMGWSITQADDGPQLPEDNNTANVYLNDSLEAADAVRRANRLASLGRWRDAAQLLQQTSASSGDNLIRVGPQSFVGVRGHINGLIAAWPAEGIDTYQALFEEIAADQTARAIESRSRTDMLRLFDQFFCTDAAAKLADTLGQLAIEAGELTLALDIYNRVLADHPNRATYATRYRAMGMLVKLIRGDDIGELSQTQADAKLRWMGEDRTLGDIVQQVRRTFKKREPLELLAEWPIFGGAPDRNRQTSTEVDEPGLLWRFDAAETLGRAQAAGERRPAERKNARADGRLFTSQPVIGGGLVIYQNYREVVALHRNTGVVAWRYHPDGTAPQEHDRIDDQPIGWDSPTVHDGRVFVSLPGDVVPYYGYQSAQNPPFVACLDASSGKIVWPTNADAFSTAHPEVGFDSSPIVRRDRLFVVGRRRRSFGFEDCYLYCFSATDGELVWRTHLGSASTGSFGARRGTNSIAAMHDGVAYVCTNLGSIAAVSTQTGDVKWLRLYERNSGEGSGESTWSGRDAVPWAFNPVFYTDGRVVFSPTDGPNVIIVTADDGRVLHEVAKQALGNMVSLLGIRGNLLCGVGEEAMCYDLELAVAVWSVPLPSGSELHGRGAWVDDKLLIPTQSGMSTFDVLDGEHRHTTWDPEGHGGNVLATPRQIIVAGRGQLSSYVRKATIWDGLRARMAAAPLNPSPALELAEIALRAGETDEALAVLEEAVSRAKASSKPLTPELQRRFFDDVLMFVDVLIGRSKLDLALLNKLYQYATQYPPDTAAHLSYRFRLAPLFVKYEEPEKALRLYHQILRDRTLRTAATQQAGELSSLAPVPAGHRARLLIAGLISDHGRSIYAQYEEEATRWLDSGRVSGDITVLANVVETFPNSHAAPRALIAQGEHLVRADQYEAGAERFARAYHRYPARVDRPMLIHKIVSGLERAGRREDAYRWASKGALEFSSSVVDEHGRAITFAAWQKRLADVRSLVEPARPDISLPLAAPALRVADDATLLWPRFGDAPGSDWSHFFALSVDGLRAYDARSGRPTWTSPVKTRLPPRLLVATNGVVLLSTPYEVLAVDLATGVKRWSHEDYPPDADDAGADWEDGHRLRTFAMHNNHLLSVRDDGQMTNVDILTGNIKWQVVHRPAPAGRVRIDRRWVVYHTVQDKEVALCLLDAATGRWVDAYMTNESRSVEDILVTPDGQIILVTTRSIAAFDAASGVRRWHVSLSGHIRPASLQMDIDSLYFSDSGRELQKIGLEDGRVIWKSEQIMPHSVDDLVTFRQAGSIIATTSSAVVAVDSVNGLVLWEGSTPAGARFSRRAITAKYVLAVDAGSQEDDEVGESKAYFYDYRSGSGMIPKKGGVLSLGPPADLRTVLPVNGGIVLQRGDAIDYLGQE